VGWIPREMIDRRLAIMSLIIVLGCNDPLPPSSPRLPQIPNETVSSYDAGAAGEIHGQVTWQGPIPSAPPFETHPIPLAGEILGKKQVRPNPNLPVIDPSTRGVRNAVVYLRDVSPGNRKPWDHTPVRVEMRDCQLHVVQGGTDSSVGFVRRGDRVHVVSVDKYFHLLHAEGAAFWNFAFPDPDSPLSLKLEKKGLVEVSSGAGYFWMRAYLFVDDHPYYARIDQHGRFLLSGVPPGRYEIVCWMPNWQKARHERDPETGMISRVYFEDPMETVQAVVVGKKEQAQVHFVISAASAGRGP
jgi:hypothetical protein